MSIMATRVPILELPAHVAICKRCGRERNVNTSKPISPICWDCKRSMSPAERKVWAA